MRNSFVKITLTLCTLLFMLAPAQALALETPQSNSNCSANAINNCNTSQNSWQTLFNKDCGTLCQQDFNYSKVKKYFECGQNFDCTNTECDVNTNADCTVNNCENNTNTNINIDNIKDEINKANVDTDKKDAETEKDNTPANETEKQDVQKNETSDKADTSNQESVNNQSNNSVNNNSSADNAANIGDYEQQVADLVNKERAANGLSALTVNSKLSEVAEKKAEDMRDKNYFSHTSPTYGSPFDMMKQFGITYTAAGENIAKGQKSPESVMDGWMNSEGHRANILNSNFTEIGIGYVTDSNGNTYWVQMFIRP
ncbi:CAP domain-containing protein [Anaerovorax odorimutans]|uniref:CAP domain-containing protein n=1 Tax=Anaerovorax odorimutans TaxID=109327 RepID=UPI0004193170|nr:CAP domain-containing protein [Anaerovorax odorimutans]